MASQFSKDGKYFAEISLDGKIKIWNTESNSYEQEFTPDFHLTSPCTCLQFINYDGSSRKIGSPKKKKRRDSQTILAPDIALGTSSGLLLVYSITKSDLDYKIDSETSQSIDCLSSYDDNLVYSGANNNILVWNLRKRNVCSKWTTGKEKIASILIIPESDRLLTASNKIKLWNVISKEVLKTFTSHTSEIQLLQYVNPRESVEDSYLISGSKRDRFLSCWSLNENFSGKDAVAKMLMEDVPLHLSVYIGASGSTNVAVTARSGVVHVYRITLNGKCSKPLKPKTTILVVSDSQKENIVPIPISSSTFRDEETLCIGYGNLVLRTFENITISSYEKQQCIVRQDPQSITSSKENQVSKLRKPIISNDVHYLTPQTSSLIPTKRKTGGRQELPMERRLENLTLNKLDSTSKVSKSDSVSTLIIQGLQSKDKEILRKALLKKDEQLIQNTVKQLPFSVVIPLIEELSTLLQGAPLWCPVAIMWLHNLMSIHAGFLFSNVDAQELMPKILGSIESIVSVYSLLGGLNDSVNLIASQRYTTNAQESQDNVEPLLTYNDRVSSDSDDESFIEFEAHSDSEEESTDNEDGSESDSEDEETLYIDNGNLISPTSENIREEQVSKSHRAAIDNDVHKTRSTKRKNDGQQKLSMERRLENLTPNILDSTSKVSKSDSVSTLVIQGLESKDKEVLRKALLREDEQLINNTVKQLPDSVIIPLIEELSTFSKDKALSCQVVMMWLRNLMSIHAGLLSNSNTQELLAKAVGSVRSRIMPDSSLDKFRGGLNLIAAVRNAAIPQELQDDIRPLLTHNDRASSDSDENFMEIEAHSDSGDEWFEGSSDKENEKEDDSESGSEDENENAMVNGRQDDSSEDEPMEC